MNALEYFGELTTTNTDVKSGKMFGCECMKTANGKAAAMLWNESLIVKLTGADADAGLKIKGAKVFEPMEGRPMNGWILIPFEQKKHWKDLLRKSIDLVKVLPAKEARRKKK